MKGISVMEKKQVRYEHNEVTLEGFLFMPSVLEDIRGAVLMVHEFTGIGEYLIPHAERLVEWGYVVLLHDMYGKENIPGNREQASELARSFKEDRPLMRERMQVGLKYLSDLGEVDEQNIFALGFSFGGCCVLELARSGAALKGTVSIYGNLCTPDPSLAGNIEGRVLALHGARDPVVDQKELNDFVEEMKKANVNCRIKVFTGAGHGFCNNTLPREPQEGIFYSAYFDSLTWQEVRGFLEEEEYLTGWKA